MIRKWRKIGPTVADACLVGNTRSSRLEYGRQVPSPRLLPFKLEDPKYQIAPLLFAAVCYVLASAFAYAVWAWSRGTEAAFGVAALYPIAHDLRGSVFLIVAGAIALSGARLNDRLLLTGSAVLAGAYLATAALYALQPGYYAVVDEPSLLRTNWLACRPILTGKRAKVPMAFSMGRCCSMLLPLF